MRFVEPKSKEQQARAILFRGREMLVRQRTALVNALRSDLYEYGHIVPKRIGEIKRIEAIIDEPNNDLPDLMREECYDLLEQIAEKAARIETKLEKLKGVAAGAGTARQLQTMPGIGPSLRWRSKLLLPTWRLSSEVGTSLPGWAWFRASTRRAASSGLGVFQRQGKPTSGGS